MPSGRPWEANACVGNSAVSRSSPSKYKATGLFISSSVHRSNPYTTLSRSPTASSFSGILAASRASNLRSGLRCIPNSSPQPHRTTQVVCAIDRVRLGAFKVSICIVEPPFKERRPPQGIINPKQVIVSVEKRRNFESSQGGELPSPYRPWIDISHQERDGIGRPEMDCPSLE